MKYDRSASATTSNCHLIDGNSGGFPDRPHEQESCFAVLVHRSLDSWRDWMPRGLESAVPEPQFGLYEAAAYYRQIGRALSHSRAINLAIVRALRPGLRPKQWATVAWADRRGPLAQHALRNVTPLQYRTHWMATPAGWSPRHLLDLPLLPWSEEFKVFDELESQPSYELALAAVIRKNRALRVGPHQSPCGWHFLVALERQPVSERLVYRNWSTHEGIQTIDLLRRFHLFDRSTWPLPDDLDIELPVTNGPFNQSGDATASTNPEVIAAF